MIYFARLSQSVNGTPLLMLDVTNMFNRKGLDKAMAFYGNVSHVFRIDSNGFTMLYGCNQFNFDSQIEQIMAMNADRLSRNINL